MSIQVEINDVIPRTQSIATAGQTVFDTDWTANVESDILVYARASGVSANDATQLIASNQYNVTFIGGQRTVRVTFLSGRSDGDIVTIVRATPADRTNLYTNTNFTTSMLNQDFGILTLVDQQDQMYGQGINFRLNVSEDIDPQTPTQTGDLVFPKAGANEVYRKSSDGLSWETIELPSIPAGIDEPYVTYSNAPTLPNAFNLGTLTSGLLKQTVLAGSATPAIAQNAVDYWAPGDELTRSQAPVSPDDVVNKAYADSIASGFTFINPVNAASTGNFNSTYNNGSSGVGATLTATSNGAFSLDGQAGVLNNSYLIKDQTNTFENGIYILTQVGDGSTPAILTRATYFDQPSEIQPGDIVPVLAGTQNGGTAWLQVATVNTVGTDPITFTAFIPAFSNVVTISGTQTITGDKTFTGLVEVPTPTTGGEAANKDYVDNNSAFASGTKMLFVQTSAPTGWTKDTVNNNNSALRVVTGSASAGGTVDFTTAFTSQAVSGTVGNTTLTQSQMPSHVHLNNFGGGVPVGSGASVTVGGTALNTGSTGGGNAHNHSFTGTAINLAVKYVDVIIATKD